MFSVSRPAGQRVDDLLPVGFANRGCLTGVLHGTVIAAITLLVITWWSW